MDKGKPAASRMVAWRGVDGLRYAKGLFKSYPMPDGKGKVYFHHEQTRYSCSDSDPNYIPISDPNPNPHPSPDPKPNPNPILLQAAL